jgi:transcriptional regulator with XRE-family HTH domain
MARKNAFQTQAEVAEKLGVTLRAYQMWEQGTEPHPHNVLKLAEHFDMDPLEFFSFEDVAA